MSVSEDGETNSSSASFHNDNDGDNDLVWKNYMTKPTGIALTCAYFVIIFTGLVGNSLVIHAVRTNRSMHTTTNYLISNIAVADLTTMATCLPFIILKFVVHPSGTFGRFLCTVFTKNNLSTITLSVSILTLCILAVERYNALVNPLQHHLRMTKRASLVAIFITWLLALFAALPLLIFTDFDEKYHYCRFTFKTHLYWIAVGSLTFLVLVVICYCYIKVLREIYRKRLLGAGSCAPQWLNNETARNKRKVTHLLLSLTLAFVLFFVPRMVYLFFSPYMGNSVNLSSFRRLTYFLVVCNSCVNPIICAFQSDNYRRAFLSMLKRNGNAELQPCDILSRRDWRNTTRQKESHF